MIIRAGQLGDAEDICAIWNPIIDETTHTFTTERKSPQDVRADLASDASIWTVAEIDGRVMGFAKIGTFRDGPGYVHTKEVTIHLAPNARGRGFGRSLMDAVERAAMDTSVQSLIACISGENDAAIAFHTALGYSRAGVLAGVGSKFGSSLDLVLMQKQLAAPF